MIRKTDWEAAYLDLIAEARQKLGEPPTAEELQAYLRGDLAAPAAARVRQLLVYYPELANALDLPFPLPGEGKPGDLDSLSDEELAQDWATLQARVASQPGDAVSAPRPAESVENLPPPTPIRGRLRRQPEPWSRGLRRWQLSTVAASLLAVFLGGLLLRSQWQLRDALTQPHTDLEHRLLLPDGQRGGTAEQPAIPLPAEAKYFLLIPALIDQPPFPDYRLDILEVREGSSQAIWSSTDLEPKKDVRIIWSGTGIHRRTDDTFEIWVPRAFLKPGKEYRLVLYGVGSGAKKPLASYTVRLSPD
jgi:hypothetical protein